MDKNLALETLKSFVKNTNNVIAKDAVLALHPELAESEDERITDIIINCIYQCCDTGFISGTQRDNVLAWLEKQEEQKPVINIEHLKSYMLQYLRDASNRKEDSEIEVDTDKYARMIIKVFGSIEQKPTDSVEKFESIDDAFRRGREVGFREGIESVKPAEWSEEDEHMLRNIIDVVDDFQVGDSYKEEIDLLKSLPERFNPQPYWKPSEEQMDALEYFIRSWGESGTMSPQNTILCAAKSLYNDIKKHYGL